MFYYCSVLKSHILLRFAHVALQPTAFTPFCSATNCFRFTGQYPTSALNMLNDPSTRSKVTLTYVLLLMLLSLNSKFHSVWLYNLEPAISELRVILRQQQNRRCSICVYKVYYYWSCSWIPNFSVICSAVNHT